MIKYHLKVRSSQAKGFAVFRANGLVNREVKILRTYAKCNVGPMILGADRSNCLEIKISSLFLGINGLS